jgi:hypothetical protein
MEYCLIILFQLDFLEGLRDRCNYILEYSAPAKLGESSESVMR